jgi:hypothetical protein
MREFHKWQFWDSEDEKPTGLIQVWHNGQTRQSAELNIVSSEGHSWNGVIAFRRVKEPVRGVIILYGSPLHGFHYTKTISNTHRMTLDTKDGKLVTGVYASPCDSLFKLELFR